MSSNIAKHLFAARHVSFMERDLCEFKKTIEEWAGRLEIIGNEDPLSPEALIWTAPLEHIQHELYCEDGVLPGMMETGLKLKEHQLRAISWLNTLMPIDQTESRAALQARQPGCIIGDAPGLGKTLIVLGFLAFARTRSLFDHQSHEERVEAGPVVIACPGTLLAQWNGEAQHNIKRGVADFLIYPTSKREKSDWWRTIFHNSIAPIAWRIILVSHSTLSQEYTNYKTGVEPGDLIFHNIKPRLVIVDEAHLAKNTGTNLFKAIQHMSQTASHTLLLTATPIHNQAENIFPLMQLINLDHSEDEKKKIKQMVKCLPIFRARAFSHWQETISWKQKSPQDMVLDDGGLIEKIGLGKEFLQQLIACIKHLLHKRYIRREHTDAALLNKKIHICHVVLSPAEDTWYKAEKEQSREGNTTTGSLKSKVGNHPHY